MEKSSIEKKVSMFGKKIKLKYAIMLWVIVLILGIGSTLALSIWASGNTTLAGNTMCFDIKYTKGQDISFSNMTASLTFDENSSASTTIGFARQNGCLLYGKGTIKANISTSVNLSTGALKYKIINNNTSEEVASGSITSTGSNTIYDNFDIIDSTTYNIFFWLDANYIDNTYLESSFSGSIEASAVSTKEYGEITDPQSLYDTIKLNASLDNTSSEFVTSSTGIDFGAISSDTNGKGVYLLSSTASDTYPIYYYRGAVDNNNVLFANLCWKIVRTTETGGIKLIYNGVPTDGTCDNTGTASQLSDTSAFNEGYDDNAYVGYMYGTAGSSSYDVTHANTNDSTIKGVIDTWYENNMTSYTDKLEDTVWCNDRSIDTVSGYGTGLGYGTNQTAYMARYRLYTNKTPSLVCSQANDRFTVSTDNGNGALTYPVGLLTADEIAYAGAMYNTTNSTYYLYTDQIWWAGSPSSFGSHGVYEFFLDSNGYLTTGDAGNAYGVRPALSLAPGTEFSSGDGSVLTPYVISENGNSSSDNAASFVTNLYNDATKTSVTTAGGESITQATDVGLEEDSFGNIRYYGADPDNYVSFNDELWRIIGVFDVEDENGTTEKRVKIARNESIGNFAYDNKPSGTGTSDNDDGSNDWTDARLMMLLNPGYETTSSLYWNRKSGTCYAGESEGTTSCDFTSTGLTTTAQSMIGQAKYYLGGSSTYDGLYADDYYNFERGTTVYSGHATTWMGYIGIMYPSDYTYATDLSVCTKDGYNYDTDTTNCTGTDWLLNSSEWQWTLSPFSYNSYRAFNVYTSGYVIGDDSVYDAGAVRPVLYLKSDISISGGEGTSSSPYTLS